MNQYFVIVDGVAMNNIVKYFSSLTDAIDFADSMEQQGYSTTVEIDC